jgi:flagellar hook-basal body complex protein FliE
MDSIAAIRPFVVPELRPVPAQTGAAPVTIPAAELQQLAPTGLATGVAPAGEARSFSGLLGQLVQDVTAKQSASSQAVGQLMTEKNIPLHQAMIAMEEAYVSFQLMVEVRNKLLESYQELMRMQV